MKDSGAPEVGDLVVANIDEKRGIVCYGTVLECRGIDCLVLWSSVGMPMGYWKRNQLKVITGEEDEDET
tara:strand:- start:1925 stop:2131 length:207 start_codon:yes stop_codon:yes gene_type:complete